MKKTHPTNQEHGLGEIRFRSPHAELSAIERDYMEKKMQKLARFFHKLMSVSVTHEELRGQHELAVHLDADGHLFHLKEKNADFRAAVDSVVNRLEHQLARYKERLRKGGSRLDRETRLNEAIQPEIEEETNHHAPSLTEVRYTDLKPMSVDEAILQMELDSQDFFVFHDVETDLFCVLYRQKNGHYGLLEVRS